jgi:hypothetical protein
MTSEAILDTKVVSNVASGWNMISLPMMVSDSRTSIQFPTAAGKAFAYRSGYQMVDTLKLGNGYWLKFRTAEDLTTIGWPMDSLAIPIHRGWNMIGSISDTVPVAQISSQPPGLATGPFFEYNGSYSVAYNIVPGKAYWVKCTADTGILILDDRHPWKKRTGTIVIVSTGELPPPPPTEGGIVKPPKDLPKAYSLDQNYPNPFNPATVFQYALPGDSKVLLTIFNTLGQRVATLVDEVQSAGYKSFTWNAGNVASGLYFYRIDATSVDDPSKVFTKIMKMALVK